MSKELTPLEALERIKNIPILSTPESTQKIFYDKHKKELDLIESALKNYQDLTEYVDTLQGDRDYWYNTAIKNENKLKALEIIKEHRLDIDWFLQFVRQDIDYKYYVYCVEQGDNKFAKRFLLTEEEYNLLKEILL